MGGLFDFSNWKFWAVTVLVIVLMYIARPYMHRMLRSVFMGSARFLNRIGLWCSSAGERGYGRYCETVAAHMVEEYENKIRNHQTRITRRVERHDVEIVGIVDELEMSSQSIEGSVEGLRDINLPKTTLDAVGNALSDANEGKPNKVTKAVTEVKRAVAAQVQNVRPQLTSIKAQLRPIEQSLDALRETSNEFGRLADRVNKDMDFFEKIISSEKRRELVQRQSIIIPWFLALLVMLIAFSGVFLNFFLIERPMAEIVGDGMQVGGLSLPAAAALVVIFLEAAAGIVLMDAAGLTSLTAIASTAGKTRKIIFGTAIGFLLIFSAFEAMLAIQREVIIAAETCVEATAVGLDCKEQEKGLSLTMIAQVLLAVLIPWLLAVAAIPLEKLVQNTIFILRIVLHQLLMLASFLAKTLAYAFKAFGVLLLRLYDLVIFLPLAIERMVLSIQSTGGQKK